MGNFLDSLVTRVATKFIERKLGIELRHLEISNFNVHLDQDFVVVNAKINCAIETDDLQKLIK